MDYSVAIIGLGYVGLPLAVESGKKHPTIGFDIDSQRINELRNGNDRTLEVESAEIKKSRGLQFSESPEDIIKSNFYIVTVPTPVDNYKQPDLTPLKSASQTVGKVLARGDIVVYESTVYPGCTEEVCVPILEKESGLKSNEDFSYGYSPERINPGDKSHRLCDIQKITSGSNEKAAKQIDEYYSSFIKAGTHLTSSIKVAEAAKVIENAQRDINIAFINELSVIFEKLDINTHEVLEAARTKWNFLTFKPGLVGGHCIGVDPYYLTYKAAKMGYHPRVILAGRQINDTMGEYVANRVVKLLASKRRLSNNAKVTILGFTFKENCPDVRNTKVIDIYNELRSYGMNVEIFDPQADKSETFSEYKVTLVDSPDLKEIDALIVAVGHRDFMNLNWSDIRRQVPVIFDVKGILDMNLTDGRL